MPAASAFRETTRASSDLMATSTTIRRRGELVGSNRRKAQCEVILHVLLDDDGKEIETRYSFGYVRPPLPDGAYALTTEDDVRRGRWRLRDRTWTQEA